MRTCPALSSVNGMLLTGRPAASKTLSQSKSSRKSTRPKRVTLRRWRGKVDRWTAQASDRNGKKVLSDKWVTVRSAAKRWQVSGDWHLRIDCLDWPHV